MAGFSVLLTGKTPGGEGNLAGALKATLNLTDEVARQIVGLVPVVLFGNLSRKQAQAVVEAMQPVGQAGGTLAVSNAPPGAMRQINWPKAPIVRGRPITAYAQEASSAAMPAVGGGAPAGAQAAPRAGQAIQCACPVCGARLVLTAARAAAAPPSPGAQAAAPPPARRGLASPPPFPRRAAAPPSPSDMSTGLTPRPGTLPAAAPTTRPGGLIIEEISSLDDLDVGSPPDVPVVPSAQRRPLTKAAPVAEELAGFDMAPMSLDDFEAGFTSGGDGVLEEIDAALPSAKPADDPLAELDALPGVEVRAQPAESNLPGSAPAPVPGGARGGYSVFASRGANPRLAEGLAQVMGIPIEEARALAKKPVIPVAKGLSKEAAEAIRARLDALKISAKVKGK